MRRLVAVVALVASSACGGSDDADGQVGSGLPDVELLALGDAAPTSLADIEGPAVVNLWATWCAPCRREIPDFEAVHRARRDEVRFVGINVGEDEERASEFVAEVGATYEQFRDDAGYVVTELGTTAMPVTLVIDADGVVSTRHLGPMDQGDLDAAIDAVVD